MANPIPTLEEFIAEERLNDPNACECQLTEDYTDLYLKPDDVDDDDDEDDDDPFDDFNYVGSSHHY